MKEKISIISVDRVKTILSCYGGQPKAWPEQEREAVTRILKDSSVLQQLQLDQLSIDQWIISSECLTQSISTEACTAHIIGNLPKQSQVINYTSSLWTDRMSRPLLLAASILFLVVGLSNHPTFSHTDEPAMSLSDFMTVYFDTAELSDESELALLAYMEPLIMDDFDVIN